MPDVLIRGGGFINKGAEAMLLTVQSELGRRLDGASFWVRCSNPEVSHAHGCGVLTSVSQGGRFAKLSKVIGGTLQRPHIRRAMRLNASAALEMMDLDHVDAVVDVSGFGYSDIWGVESCKAAVAWTEYCRDSKRPYMFLPQAWGPFKDPQVARYSRELCRDAEILYARDHVSLENLHTLDSAVGKGAVLAPDIVFRYSGGNRDLGAQVLAGVGVNVNAGPVVGLSPNMRVYQRMGGTGASNEYVRLMVQIAQYCQRELDATVVLIPNETYPGDPTLKDDRFLCGLIRSCCDNTERIFSLVDFYVAEKIKSVIMCCDLLVGSRFHALVFGLSSGVPAVAIGWSHKYQELMRLVGLESFVVDYAEADSGELFGVVDNAWRQRGQNKAVLAANLPAIGQEVDAVFDRVAKAIQGSLR